MLPVTLVFATVTRWQVVGGENAHEPEAVAAHIRFSIAVRGWPGGGNHTVLVVFEYSLLIKHPSTLHLPPHSLPSRR